MKYRWLFPPILLVFAALSLAPVLTLGQTYQQGRGQEPILGPMRSSYIPLGPGDKMITTADLDGAYVKTAVAAADNSSLTLTVQLADNTQQVVTFVPTGGSSPGGSGLTQAQVEALVGAMVTSNAETGGVTLTYNATTKKLDIASALPDSTASLRSALVDTTAAVRNALADSTAAARGHAQSISGVSATTLGDSTAIVRRDLAAAIHDTATAVRSDIPAIPAYSDAETKVLHARGALRYWDDVNEVPNTPGTQSGITRVLTVTGENDKDYAWRDPAGGTDQTARDLASAADAQASSNADDIGTNTRNIGQLGTQNNNLQRQITELDRQTADLDIVSDGLGWAEAKAADAGIALFAEGSTIGDGLLNDTRDLMQADVDGVTMWRQTIGLGATVQAVVVRIEGTLGPLDFSLQQGDDTYLPIYTDTKVLSDSQWDYYFLAGLSNSRITINRRTNLTHTRFHGELAGRALAQLGDGTDQGARASAAANKAIIDRLSVFSHVHLDPPGISGNDFPTFIGILLSNKIIDKTITRLRITLGGEQLLDAQQPQDLADLNLSGPGVTELSGALLNGALSPTARSNLKSNTQPATQYINCQIQYTFSDGTSATDRTSFGTNNNAFLSSGLNQSEVDARIATLVNDDRILDLAKPTRFVADRGKFLGIADTNQDSIVILDAPSGSGGRTEAEVNTQIRAGVQDWAETGNSDAIPRSPKLNNVNDDLILDLAQASRTTADRGKLIATSPSNENNMVLISPPPVVVVTDRDAQPIKATGTRGTGTEAARNDHVHPLKLATNSGLDFTANDSLQIAVRPLVVLAWDANRASYADVVLPTNYTNWSEVTVVILDNQGKEETQILSTAGLASDFSNFGETDHDSIKWTASTRTLARQQSTRAAFRFIYVALRP